ncbi:hypothetical protein [Mumia zhuanghuii]|uniref:Uncharacterized protein n=1 Tax=Mumia zhuanghuii TaxID=2585211 RepID=A0A5C4M7D7_9ACTN|nr:hypothetical protein [Mumia zhuanghuii]TNC28426.1 hypothetical protein FHE65_33945 [Mumia zhuanghuii]
MEVQLGCWPKMWAEHVRVLPTRLVAERVVGTMLLRMCCVPVYLMLKPWELEPCMKKAGRAHFVPVKCWYLPPRWTDDARLPLERLTMCVLLTQATPPLPQLMPGLPELLRGVGRHGTRVSCVLYRLGTAWLLLYAVDWRSTVKVFLVPVVLRGQRVVPRPQLFRR